MPQHFHSRHLHSALYNEICSKFICVRRLKCQHLASEVGHVAPKCKHTRGIQTAPHRCRNKYANTRSVSDSLPLYCSFYRRLCSVESHCCCVHSLAESLFWRLIRRGDPVNSQACSVRSNSKDSGSELQQTIPFLSCCSTSSSRFSRQDYKTSRSMKIQRNSKIVEL